jgi:hypothetical protein
MSLRVQGRERLLYARSVKRKPLYKIKVKLQMKLFVRTVLVIAVAALCLCGRAYAGAKAVVGGAFATQLLDAKTAVGQDGLLRVLFDYNPAQGGASTYSGSALWIINPNGSFVAAGNPIIPASVGTFYFATHGGEPIFSFERSRTVLFAQADGNTTVLFFYGQNPSGARTTFSYATSFGLWTYNSAGNLIAAAAYGPYTSTQIQNCYFDTTGNIVVKWASGPNSGVVFRYAGWVLNEFGAISSATSYYGPFGPGLGKIRINAKGQQIWPFSFPSSGGTYFTNIWTFNPSGSAIANAVSFGPF